MEFKLKSDFAPTGDQLQAIEKLARGVKKNLEHQVLIGVTGSGKTFTIANLIEKVQKPTLVISHNKTLAAQLYQEFRDLFPGNAVSYFVSYYDYYQPEAYIAQTDTYIEKETEVNELIDKLRLAATTNLLTRRDTIVVASVSCIYNIGSPFEYGRFVLELSEGLKISQDAITRRLAELQYERSDFGFHRGTFRVRGDTIDVFPAYQDAAIRISLEGDKVISILDLDPISGRVLVKTKEGPKSVSVIIYPAKHYMTDPTKLENAFEQIRQDLKIEAKILRKEGKELEAHRLEARVNFDLEMLAEVGYVNGIENYSRYFDGRKPGEPPYTLLDYFSKPYAQDFLVVIDESHMTIPQIGGMYNGDRARKEMLVGYGFRLKAAFDNRPLIFAEFLRRVPKVIYTSATPGPWELSKSQQVVEQLVRPTGIPDPEIEIKPTEGQIDYLISEIEKRAARHQRVLVTTLTKRMAEDLASYLGARGIKVHYLHSEIETLDRTDILDDLRLGKYNCLVGINLLREGLDLPEVSLVAILDADKEGFLRSETSLIQVMGRAARHVDGKVIMFADNVTGSMKRAIKEVERRRKYQLEFNKKHGLIPRSIEKPIREKLIQKEADRFIFEGIPKATYENLSQIDPQQLPPSDRTRVKKQLRRFMKEAAQDLNFELAAQIRDKIYEIEAIGI